MRLIFAWRTAAACCFRIPTTSSGCWSPKTGASSRITPSSFCSRCLGNGLLLNEGESWLRQRRLIQPAFSKPRVESYAPAMAECTQRMLDRVARWRQTHDIVAGHDAADDGDCRPDAARHRRGRRDSTKSPAPRIRDVRFSRPASARRCRCPFGCRRRATCGCKHASASSIASCSSSSTSGEPRAPAAAIFSRCCSTPATKKTAAASPTGRFATK